MFDVRGTRADSLETGNFPGISRSPRSSSPAKQLDQIRHRVAEEFYPTFGSTRSRPVPFRFFSCDPRELRQSRGFKGKKDRLGVTVDTFGMVSQRGTQDSSDERMRSLRKTIRDENHGRSLRNFEVSRVEGGNLAANFLIRGFRSAARPFLHTALRFFPSSTARSLLERATLESPLEGADFAPPLFFLFFPFLSLLPAGV